MASISATARDAPDVPPACSGVWWMMMAARLAVQTLALFAVYITPADVSAAHIFDTLAPASPRTRDIPRSSRP